MLWLVLAVSCNLAIAMLFKYSERRGLDRAVLLTVNYAVASILAAVFVFIGEGGPAVLRGGLGLPALSIGTGVLFIGGYYLFAYSIREAGMGLATGIVKIAVVLPVLASWVIWKEVSSSLQMAGLVLAGAAFFLIAQPGASAGLPRGAPHKHGRLWMAGVLGLLFLSGGLVDIAMKTFGEIFASTNSRSLFLLFVFSVAFLVGVGLVLGKGMRTRQWPERPEYGWGLLLGLVNYGSAAFILGAIDELPGPFVFPVNNIAIVVGAAALGVGVWGERLSKTNWTGLAMAAAALALLWG
ncbi:MAG: EamA family transporter [Bacteroidetes bacterium]|nr:EamA family transporter [Bacteroidota bacterium]